MTKMEQKSCGDCWSHNTSYISYELGCYLCQECKDIHSRLQWRLEEIPHYIPLKDVPVIKQTTTDDALTNAHRLRAAHHRRDYEINLPFFYQRPYPGCPSTYRHYFILAKYIWRSFSQISRHPLPSITGALYKRGILLKRHRDHNKFVPRTFILDVNHNSLKYYVKETDSEPKAIMNLEKMNVAFVDHEAYGVPPNTVLVNYSRDGATRNLFLRSADLGDIVAWFNAIRFGKFHRICMALSGMAERIDGAAVAQRLTQNVVLCAWLEKTGPRATDAWRKRWVYILGRKLLYTEEPTSAYPKGQTFLGHASEGYRVDACLPPMWQKHSGFAFTVRCPLQVEGGSGVSSRSQLNLASLPLSPSTQLYRDYVFVTPYREVRDRWVSQLRHIINSQPTLEDRKEAAMPDTASVKSIFPLHI